MRRLLALVLSVAVQAAALGTPLVHAHPDEHATAHHLGDTVHAHWSGHGSSHHDGPAGAPVLGASDHDRAIYQAAFFAVAVQELSLSAVATVVCDLPVPEEQAAHRWVVVTHGHDPPAHPALAPRAPPFPLS